MKKTILIALGVIVLIGLIVGAAFVGGQLLYQSTPTSKTAGGKIQMTAAKELPQESPIIKGVFVSRNDSSVMVGTGRVQANVSKNADGTISVNATYDGPIVEVVFTHDTVIYRDETEKQFNGRPPPDATQVQQVVAPGSLDEIGTNTAMIVWGERRGDRVTATTVLYALPEFIPTGAGAAK